jgi:hypothetical protein
MVVMVAVARAADVVYGSALKDAVVANVKA